jgi:hypothetical protein
MVHMLYAGQGIEVSHMNRAQGTSELPRKVLVAAIAIMGAGYAAAMVWLGGAEGVMPRTDSGTSVSTGSAIDVPAGMETTLAARVGQVVPNLDELFVFPAADGQGFTVSMTISYVGDQAPTDQQIKRDVDALFPASYNSHEPVEDVEAYFSFNGDILAGAEMGKSAYRALSAATTSNQGSLADLLAHAKVVTTEGSDTSWMEVDSTVPTGGSGT